jgi:hypothetical protein
MSKSFNPNDHMMNLKGKDYLPVAPRLAWLNDDQQSGNLVPPAAHGRLSVETELVEYSMFEDTDKGGKVRKGWQAVVRARVSVRDADNNLVKLGTGTKRQTNFDFADFVEKAETGAVGRALAAIGYGTIQSLDFEEGEKPSPIDGVVGPAVVDAPYAPVTPSLVAAPLPAPVVSPAAPSKPRPTKIGGKVTVSTSSDPLLVLTQNPVPVSSAPAANTPPAPGREEQLAWLKNHINEPQVAQLMNETIKKFKAERVSDLPDEHLKAAYEAALAFATN